MNTWPLKADEITTGVRKRFWVPAVIVAGIIVLLVVIGSIQALTSNHDGGSSTNNRSSISDSCRTAYGNSFDKRIGISEKHYVDNCVKATSKFVGEIGDLSK